MKVLVTGGKGDLGTRLTPILEQMGHDVAVGTRRPEEERDVRYTLDSDPADALEGVETVVHLASDPVHPQKDLESVRRLIEGGEKRGVEHIVYISIVGIDEHPLPYYRVKVACEEELAKIELGWTVLRATQFHSFLPRIAELLRRGPVTIVPKGYRIQPVDADVVAQRLAELVVAGPSGRVRDIGGPEIIDVAETIKTIPTSSGKRRVVSVPIPGKLGRAFRDGLNLLDESGDVVGSGYTTWSERA